MGDDFKMPDLGNLMKVAQDMQARVAKAQEELAAKTCEGSSGGGMVTAVVNGHCELVSLTIDREVVDPNELVMLQDLVVAATNQAIRKAREMGKEEMAKLTGGMSIPGMPDLV